MLYTGNFICTFIKNIMCIVTPLNSKVFLVTKSMMFEHVWCRHHVINLQLHKSGVFTVMRSLLVKGSESRLLCIHWNTKNQCFQRCLVFGKYFILSFERDKYTMAKSLIWP